MIHNFFNSLERSDYQIKISTIYKIVCPSLQFERVQFDEKVRHTHVCTYDDVVCSMYQNIKWMAKVKYSFFFLFS